MSAGPAIPFGEALGYAKEIHAALEPHVVRVKVAGSLRRRRRTVGDIELVAEPRMIEVDLFGTKAPDTAPVRAALEEHGRWVKGGERFMQVTDVLGIAGFNVDLFLVHPPATWGSILAIRTGPWEFSRHLVTEIGRRGLQAQDGFVFRPRTGETIPTPDEKSFFELAGVPFLAPALRETYLQRLTA